MNYRILFTLIVLPLYSMPKPKVLKKYSPLTVNQAHQAVRKERAAKTLELSKISKECVAQPHHSNELKIYHDIVGKINEAVPSMPMVLSRLVGEYLPILRTWQVSRYLSGHSKPITNLLTTSDGQLFSTSADGSIKLWSLEVGEHAQEQSVQTLSPWGVDGGIVRGIALTPRGDLAVSNATSGSLVMYPAASLKASTENQVSAFSYYASGLAVLTSGLIACAVHTALERRKNTIMIIDLQKPESQKIIHTEYYEIECIVPIAGGGLAIGCRNDWTEIVSPGEEKEHKKVPTVALFHPDDYDGDNFEHNELKGHQGSIYVLKTLTGGKLASGSSDKEIRIWDLATKKIWRIFPGHTSSISCIEQLPNGDLVSSDFNGNIIIWDIQIPACKQVLNYLHAVHALAVGLNDTFISAGRDGLITIWENNPCQACRDGKVMPPKAQTAPPGKSHCCVVM